MADNERASQDDVQEVVQRNIEGMRELLEEKHQRDEGRSQEVAPAVEDTTRDRNQDPLVNLPVGDRGSTGGERNMGGGRS